MIHKTMWGCCNMVGLKVQYLVLKFFEFEIFYLEKHDN